MTKKRAHRATGRAKGGARPGAGRPQGSKNDLPMGAIKAIKALNMRVPKNATDTQKEILAESEEAVLKVMRGKVHGSIAGPVLKAVVTVREEICGPIAQKLDLTAKVGFASILDEVAAMEAAEAVKEVHELAGEAAREAVQAVEPKGPVIRRKKDESIQ